MYQIKILKCKLKEVVVTEANSEYEGSITLDRELMEAAGLREFEYVEVNAKSGTARINTYVIAGEKGMGDVELNGGAANFFKPGDVIHVNCFKYIDNDVYDLVSYNVAPKIVVTDKFITGGKETLFMQEVLSQVNGE